MSYCPECGEPIAKVDVFCPYCGISVKAEPAAEGDLMSETIMDMPVVVENKEPASKVLPEENSSVPKESPVLAESPEKPIAPEIEEKTEDAEKAVGFSAGNTSENWTMKTESVEIPANVLNEGGGVPLADLNKAPEMRFPEESAPEDNPSALPPTKVETPLQMEDIPAPAIIRDLDFDLRVNPDEKPFVPEIPPLESGYGTGRSEQIDEPVLLDKTEKTDYSEKIVESPEVFDAFPPKEADALSDGPPYPVGEKIEPAIAMPDAPLEMDVPEEPAKFDSVQIIQKDEKAPEVAEPTPIPEPPVAKVEEPPKEGRSYTTPNISNSDTDGRKAAKLKPLDEGVILNARYEIVRKIGGGGMGAVYLANDRNLGGVLRAVKEMVQSYIESDQQDKAINDFKRESLLLTSLDHPAIPTIFDYFFDEKEARFYLVMKYISGGDLSGRLRAAPEGRIDEKSVTEWSIQIADVLDYLHNHEPPIVYRDLKPANVMIDGNSGRVMLIDFGIARWINKEEKGVTAVGTMGYAPPELFSGNVEPRSDIYSLGSTMFHLLTGADPQSNPLLIFDFQKNPRPRQINSQLSDQIEQILMRAVEYNAEARFLSAAELRDELKAHLINLQLGKVTYGIKVAPTSPTFSEQSVFCGFCGKQIVATDVFCAFCGAQQPIAQQSFHNQPFIQAITPKLMVMGTGELDASSFKLEKNENLIGRRDPMSNIFPEVDLSKYDPQTKISRRHARIWREGNSFLVEDLGSSNGTTLLPVMNDSIRLLPHQPHTLTNGDKIRLGDTTLHFTIG